MAVGEKYAFLAFGNTVTGSADTAGATLTFGTSATGLPATAARVVNVGTATAFVAFGTAGTTFVATAGMILLPVSQNPNWGVFRTGGVNAIVAKTVGATQTTNIYVTGGEGNS